MSDCQTSGSVLTEVIGPAQNWHDMSGGPATFGKPAYECNKAVYIYMCVCVFIVVCMPVSLISSVRRAAD